MAKDMGSSLLSRSNEHSSEADEGIPQTGRPIATQLGSLGQIPTEKMDRHLQAIKHIISRPSMGRNGFVTRLNLATDGSCNGRRC